MEGWLIMFIAGIVGSKGNNNIVKNISTLLSGKSIKISCVDLKNFTDVNSDVLLSYLKELSRNEIDLAIIYLNEDNIKFVDRIKVNYDIMMFYIDSSNIKFLESSKDSVRTSIDHIKNDGFLIINSDMNVFGDILEGKSLHLVTYGFNSKAIITASSVGESPVDDYFLCSLQRPNIDIKKRISEPQEYKVKRPQTTASDYEMLALIAFGVVAGIDINF